jgi:RNA polymerase sigma-70 factor (ECF subfamily)
MTERHPFHTQLPEQAQPLRRRALKLTRNPHRADDLVQETLLKAWASRDSYRPDTQLRAWLFTILRNAYFSDLRKYRREVEDVDGSCAERLFELPAQDHALALKELIAAIALLPSTQRRALVLMGAYGFSQLEAADACGCSVGTIKSRVGRGRARLNLVVDHDGTAHSAGPSRVGPVLRVSRHPHRPPDYAVPHAEGLQRAFPSAGKGTAA